MNRARYILNNDGCGTRQGESYEKVMFLLTDGNPNYHYKHLVYEEAAKVKNENIKMIAIGVGEKPKIEILSSLTGSTDLVFKVKTFDDLIKSDLIRKLTERICVVDPIPTTTFSTTVQKTPSTTTTTTKVPTTTCLLYTSPSPRDS